MIRLLYYETLLSNKENENMEEPSPQNKIINRDNYNQFLDIEKSKIISKRVNTAFSVALKKLLDKHGNVESVIQTGEAFGRGLFTEFIEEKPNEWTMKKWIDVTTENIFDPMGNSFTIAEIENDSARSLMTKSPLQEYKDEENVVSLFTYGFIRGLLLSAFPKGELLMGSTMILGDPITEFTFKSIASYKDRFERQRVKNLFTTSKKI